MEYTGQCIGGPDNGNLVTATVEEFRHVAIYRSELDGPRGKNYIMSVHGWYVWDPAELVFNWKLDKSTSGVV